MEAESQKFCLRWNNHRSNLIQFFDELRRKENFTDVTLVSDAREVIKCHKIVLAAGSFYFERVFNNVGFEDSTTLIFTQTNITLLEALIMYMYRGEINIEQEELEDLLKVAEKLEVKGLINFAEKESLPKFNGHEIPSPVLCHTPPPPAPSTTPRIKLENGSAPPPNPLLHSDLYNFHLTNQNINPLPPHGLWSMPAFPFAQHPYHPHYSALSRSYVHSSDTSPLTKKKKISSASMAGTAPTTTPILRTALVGQEVEAAHSTSGSNMENVESVENGSRSNGSASASVNSNVDNDRRYSTDFSHPEDLMSPHTDIEDDDRRNSSGSRRNSLASSSTAPKEWKRYKQYTREDINAAIEVVRAGEMSALRASRKFNVPSRTLYDKVKKLGIVTQRHSGRNSSRSGNSHGIRMRSMDHDSARFPYGVGGNADGNIYRNAYGVGEPTDMLMDARYASSSTSPKDEPIENNSLEDMVEDLSIKTKRHDTITIRPLTPKEELKEETPAAPPISPE